MIFFAEFPVRQILKLFAGLFREKFASEGAKCAFGRYKMAKISHKKSPKGYILGITGKLAFLISLSLTLSKLRRKSKQRSPATNTGSLRSLWVWRKAYDLPLDKIGAPIKSGAPIPL